MGTCFYIVWIMKSGGRAVKEGSGAFAATTSSLIMETLRNHES